MSNEFDELEDTEDEENEEDDVEDSEPSTTKPTKIEKKWAEIFEAFPILEKVNEDGFHEISASEINVFHQARLMTKFDHISHLPKLFCDHKLSIQPTSRGTYVIGRFESYFKTSKKLPTPEEVELPLLETINPEKLGSESAAILCAYYTGMLADISKESSMDFTVFGRIGTGVFDYEINDRLTNSRHKIKVRNAQCEVDGGFESNNFFYMVEAKNATIKDFLVRQLYYPYRLWTSKITKPVVPLFLTYSNDVFVVRKFEFRDLNWYNSLELVDERSYIIAPRTIELQDIIDVWEKIKHNGQIISASSVTFPQADSFARVLDLLVSMRDAPLYRNEVSVKYDIAPRQVNYYTDATRYLGLAEKQTDDNGINYALTTQGRRVMSQKPRKRNLELVERILRHEVFHNCFGLYLQKHKPPTNDEVVQTMKQSQIVGLDKTKSTYARRASTVRSWLRWILDIKTGNFQ
jgi:hypothetical protein